VRPVKRTSEKQARRDAVAAAKRALHEAESSYKRRVKSARDLLAQNERSHEQELKSAQRVLWSAEESYNRSVSSAEARLAAAKTGQLLGSYGNQVRLYDNRLETPDGVVALSRDVKANVEVSGVQTKERDLREVVLLLDTPRFDSVIRCDPNHTTHVREFAAKINTAAKNAEQRIARYNAAVAVAERELTEQRADRAAIETAKGKLAQVEANTSEIEAAHAAVRTAEGDTSEIERRKDELLALDPEAKLRETRPPRANGPAFPGVTHGPQAVDGGVSVPGSQRSG
jgi:hypothetical protein